MSSPKFISAVMALPINAKGQMLLTQRHNPKNPNWHNKWQVAGGAIEFGEKPEQALARELQEELNVSAQILFPYPIVKTISYQPGQDEEFPKLRVHITFVCYLVDIGGQKIDVSQDEETCAYRWIYPHQVRELDCLPLTPEFVAEADSIINKQKLLAQLRG